MRKLLFIVILLFTIQSLHSERGWNSVETNTGLFLYGVCFVDSLYGWAVGDEGLILHTKDGGREWEIQEANVGSWLLSVHFVDRWHGWTVGDFGRVRKTTNGGRDWKIVESVSYPETLNSVFFANRNEGWAIGIKGIIHTEDGGESWEFQMGDTIPVPKSIFFIDEEIGWACGANGTIFHTVDGGNTWQKQAVPNNGIVYDIFFLDMWNGWAVCRNAPRFLKTTNGGNDWEIAGDVDDGFFKRIQFIDKNIGWAVGPGGILRTSNGGENWKTQIPNTRYNLWWASFVDSTCGYAVGGDGLVLKTTDGGDKFIVDFSSNVRTGTAPMSATFTDLSEGEYNEWHWDFGDGGTHAMQHPVYIYQEAGTYSVKLRVSDGLDKDSLIKYSYIKVKAPDELIADFVADTTLGTVPLTVQFTDLSEGSPDDWEWDFGDGGTHKTQNPLHIYQSSGTFTVELKIKRNGDNASAVKHNYIIVNKPISVDEFNDDILINLSPNPASDKLLIDIESEESTPIQINAYDFEGRIIKELYNAQLTGRTNRVYWDLKDEQSKSLAPGVYYIKIKTSQKEITRKLIIIK